jgi:subtilisin family serine protease
MRELRLLLPFLAVAALFPPPSVAGEHRAVVAPGVAFLEVVKDNPPAFLQPGIVDSAGFSGTVRFVRELTREEIELLEWAGVSFSRRYGHGGPRSLLQIDSQARRSDRPTCQERGPRKRGGVVVAYVDSISGCSDAAGRDGRFAAAGGYSQQAPMDVDRIGAIYPVRISWNVLSFLETFPLTIQVESEYLIRPVQPLNVTKPMTGALQLTDALARQTGALPGQGVRIADIDSGIDVFHPSFFRADAGYFSWLDVDGDGALTLGVDACDLDRDGLASAGETLRFHDVSLVNAYDAKDMKFLDPDGVFESDIDWLYADVNGNEERDFGRDDGFDDSAPAFGEPIFVMDDVNRNGELDREEKLVRLGTTKIRKVLIGEKEYVAGTNLTEVTSALFPSSTDGMPTAMHGTGVAGILAANTPGLNRFVGMAPYADLYMIDSSGGEHFAPGGVDGTVSKLIWAKQQAIQILLFEFSSWGLTFMDGTSNLEKAMDQLFKDNGMTHVVPAGNLATSGKHMETTLPAGESEVGVTLPDLYPGYLYYPYETPVYIFSLYWKGKTDDLEVSVALPESASFKTIPLNAGAETTLGSKMAAFSAGSPSISGFAYRMNFVMDTAQKEVLTGTWRWKLKNKSGAPLAIHGYLMDYVSSWDRVIEFDKWESTKTTICHPSTADSAISVAAYGGEFGPPEELGKLRDYSSRGPRMDGYTAIDITAPDDPYTPLARFKTGLMMGNRDIIASYTVFGGTSGAGPHVAGTLALLKQLDPAASPQQLFDKVIAGAVVEPEMAALPNPDWGFGKLNIYKTATGSLPAPNQPPAAQASVWRNGLSATLSALASSDPDGEPLQYEWDFDYDGVWDAAWSDSPEVERSWPAAGSVVVKLAVRDPAGATAYALLSFDLAAEVVDPIPQVPEETADVLPGEDSGSTPFPVDSGGEESGSGSDGCSAGTSGRTPTALPLLFLLLLLASTLTISAYCGRPPLAGAAVLGDFLLAVPQVPSLTSRRATPTSEAEGLVRSG